MHGTHLYHEVFDVTMKDGVCIVASLRKDEEVLASARGKITVQLQVEVAQIGVQPHITLLCGVTLHPNLLALIAGHNFDCSGRE